MESGKNLRRRRSPEAALAKPGMRHYKLKNVSWSLSPALAPSSAEQEGDVSYSVHSSAKTSEIMPRKPLLSPWDPYSHMQLFRTWCTKDKARHHWLKPCRYSLPLVAGTLGAVPRWQSWRLLFMLPTPKNDEELRQRPSWDGPHRVQVVHRCLLGCMVTATLSHITQFATNWVELRKSGSAK